ncbi:carboxypeptidase-like regulatory domain-containing protein [Massilia sp. H-1]|nr:carboxypeptidase-like regulatory domain-containing protein [Massilia sp. H-1]
MKTSEFRVLAALVAVLLISHGLSAVAAPKAIEGTVFHAESGAPMAGVFVFAQYKQSGSQPFGHSASWCVMTRRVYTGSDGRFRFPGEPDTAVTLTAIFPNFTEQLGRRFTESTTWLGTRKQIISPNLYMAPRGSAALTSERRRSSVIVLAQRPMPWQI